jgi:hypothetical protein
MSGTRTDTGDMSDAERPRELADKAERLAKQITDPETKERLLQFAAEKRAALRSPQVDGTFIESGGREIVSFNAPDVSNVSPDLGGEPAGGEDRLQLSSQPELGRRDFDAPR